MESTPQQASEGKAVVAVLAAVLERLVNSNAHLSHGNGDNVTKFHALKAPGISIQQYLERVGINLQYVLSHSLPTHFFINYMFIDLTLVLIKIYYLNHETADTQICILLHRVLYSCPHIH